MTTPPIPSNETAPASDPLERRLAALTDWRDAEPTLHEAALRKARAGAAGPRRLDGLGRMRIRPAVAVPVVAAATLVLVAAAQLWTGLGRERGSPAPAASVFGTDVERTDVERMDTQEQNGEWKGGTRGRVAGGDRAAPASPPAEPSAAGASERSVIRKASIEIQCKDVRADFARAALLVNEGLGEFVEASSLTGEGASTQGTLTLRVTAERLSDVLNALRDLGTVVTEKSSGDDVTEQVVDLSARLRNEQRIEAELLGLLESRKGAPLKDLLDMREQLAKVRERIEQLTAQQERLGRSVSLATVLVILRPEPQPDHPVDEKTNQASTWDYFGERMTIAWHTGTRALADSAAALVGAIVGGLVWWTALVVAMAACLRLVREAKRRAAREPVPAL